MITVNQSDIIETPTENHVEVQPAESKPITISKSQKSIKAPKNVKPSRSADKKIIKKKKSSSSTEKKIVKSSTPKNKGFMPGLSFNNKLGQQPMEPETDESDDEDDHYLQIVEDIMEVHPAKKQHFMFLNIDIKTLEQQKHEKEEEERRLEREEREREGRERNTPRKQKGYGNQLGVNKYHESNNRSVKSSASKKSSKPIENIKNNFQKTSISKIKRNYNFQILLGSTTKDVKSFFGCISTELMDYYKVDNKKKSNNPNFLRKKAMELEYTDNVLTDLKKKLRKTQNFKQIHKYNDKERLAMDSKVREARAVMDNFVVDQFMFEQFFEKLLPLKDFISK